jgi:predicted lipoprotein with Yx(FWY)xxD motif
VTRAWDGRAGIAALLVAQLVAAGAMAADAPAKAAAAPVATASAAADGSASAAQPASADSVPANLRLRRVGDEEVLTDARGFSLYTTDEDAIANVSTCVDACAKAWPPVTAPADARPVGEFTLVSRADGSRQWAYRGKPLYGFAREEYAGGTFGDGVANRWRLAFRPLRTPPGIGVMKAPIGRILVSERSQPLFTPSAGNAVATQGCDAKCLVQWSPVPAPALARPQGDWSLVTRPDGTRQWAYRKQPLYVFRADRRVADLKGFEPKHAGWQPIVVQPELAAPSWATLVKTDVGQVFADAKGLTVYAFNGDLEKIKRTMCDDACLQKAWTRLEADADTPPAGDWSVKKNADGKHYWAYRGAPLFRFRQDTMPGEVLGNQFAAGAGIFGNWSPIVRMPP